MTIDLDRLWEPHAERFNRRVKELAFNAALALQRRHAPGVTLRVDVGGASHDHDISWTTVDEEVRQSIDEARATEDGAEGISVGLVHAIRGWTLSRRMQRRQYGDWLVVESGSARHVVLEVGGLDAGSINAKLEGEIGQVVRCPLPYDRAACAVRFEDVTAKLVEIPNGPP